MASDGVQPESTSPSLALGREDEQRLLAILEQLPAGVAVVGLDRRYILCNSRMRGYAPDTIPAFASRRDETWRATDRFGKPVPPEEWPGPRALRGETVGVGLEVLYLPEDRWIFLTAAPFHNHAGQIIGAIVVLQDITERKRAEEALRQSEAKFRASFAHATIGFAMSAPDGRFIEVNPAYCRLSGYEAAELRATTFSSLVHPDDEPANVILVRRLLEGQISSFVLENRYVRKDGAIVWVRKTVSLVRGETGAPLWVVALVEDINERKLAEEARDRLAQQRQLALDAARLGWWHYDPVTKMASYDERYCEIFGVSGTDCANDELLSRIHPDDRPKVWAKVEAALNPADPKPYAAQYRVNHPDGLMRWVQAYGMASFEGAGAARRATTFAGTVEDITERKEFLAELERLVAERTAKLQELVGELEHFSYTITHDMRAPLRSMRGFAELVQELCAPGQEQEQKALLRRIISSAERMDLLITDALSYSKAVRQELLVGPVDVGLLLRGMLDSYPEFQSHNARIEIEGQIPLVLGNQAGLTQCFSNLLDNAIKFVEPGATPRIRIHAESLPVIPVMPGQPGQPKAWIRIFVVDNGIGISPEMLPRVFHMFARGSSDYEGTGIGLALVRKVVDRMGGRVGVRSEPGRGSCFWIDLQSASPSATAV